MWQLLLVSSESPRYLPLNMFMPNFVVFFIASGGALSNISRILGGDSSWNLQVLAIIESKA